MEFLLKRYLRKELYKYLTEHGDLERAISYARKLSELSMASPEDNIAFSEIHKVFELLRSIEAGNTGSVVLKTEKPKRISAKHQEIIDFLTVNNDSDSKTISKAVCLRVARTRDYLKQLIEMGEIETSGKTGFIIYRLKNNVK